MVLFLYMAQVPYVLSYHKSSVKRVSTIYIIYNRSVLGSDEDENTLNRSMKTLNVL